MVTVEEEENRRQHVCEATNRKACRCNRVGSLSSTSETGLAAPCALISYSPFYAFFPVGPRGHTSLRPRSVSGGADCRLPFEAAALDSSGAGSVFVRHRYGA